MACSLRSPPRHWPTPSLGQRKGFGFQFDEDSADTADGTIEIGRLRHFEISEHPRRPRLEMSFEEFRLLAKVGLEVAARQTRHYFEQDRCVIFGFARSPGALDA